MAYHIVPDGDPVVLYEVLAGVERVAQPTPEFVQGGDCFQCAAYAILQHFARQKGEELPVDLRGMYEQVWSHPDVGMAKGGSQVSKKDTFWIRWNDLIKWWGLRVDTVVDPPLDLSAITLTHMTFGPQFYTGSSLLKRLRVYLEAGYVAYAEMQKRPSREIIRAGFNPSGADHVVVIDGYRQVYQRTIGCNEERADWGGSYEDEIHVVCSARSSPEPYWIKVWDWVRDHGGYDMRFVRPKRVPPSPPWPDEDPVCAAHSQRRSGA